MDVEARYNTRYRGQSHLHKGTHGVQDDSGGSGGESESNLVRRKFQRTATDPTETDTTFRKPSLPASATRQAGLESRPSLSQRRRSTLRENVRVPSGPREFPSPTKQRQPSNAPSLNDTTNNTRSFLPQSNSESFMYNSRTAGAANMSRERLSFGNNTTSSNDSADLPTTPAERSNGGGSLGFLPDINFDDFQTSIKNYDGTSPMLSDFPSLDGGRILSEEESYNTMARSNGVGTSRRQEEQPQKQHGMTRTQSLRQRLGAGRQASGGQQNAAKEATSDSKQSSFKNRRQSTVPQTATTQDPAATSASSKPPRKSVGPGLITSMMKGSGQQEGQGDNQPKSSVARTSSLSKARRTTMQPSPSAGAEVPRVSTLTATTQSRQNKVKSLQPPPKNQEDPNSTPSSVKSGKSGQNRAHTPSSGSGRRQSMASGRASGLGARTISPTDARRLKRMSMNPPPMPTAYLGGKLQPSPQEEVQNPMNNVPRMAQPSPSLIPRKTSNATPSSARASPDPKTHSGGGVSLALKSSFSSLANASANGSSSRLPTPKPRNSTQSNSALGQYGDRQYTEVDYNELVPPVPAIPKAFESPQDEDHRPFFSSSLKSSQSGANESAPSTGWTEVSALPAPQRISQTPRGSLDIPASETPKKRSGEFSRHRRTNTGGSVVQVPAPPAPPKTASRAQPSPNGRKNANLQPIRLPPLNLMPISGTRTLHSTNNANSFPRPSQETDFRDPTDWSVQTPEPKRTTKTPSTPMTASKATFFRRQEEKALRSSSSHYALRDVMGMDSDGNMTRYWDDSDIETAGQGVPIPNSRQPRNAITPFASGSLPKNNPDLAKQMRGRPSGEYEEDPYSLGNFENLQWQSAKPQGPRLRTGTQTTVGSMSIKSPWDAESPSISEQPGLPDAKKEGSGEKKEGSGLRRKLSLGWRRTSSKGANHADNKNSPQQENGEKHEKTQKLQKRASEMPPPKLPASATWSGDVPSLPSSARPSIEQNSALGHARRKSQLPASVSQASLPSDSDNTSGSGHTGGVRTRALHSEQPTPVTSNARASSWSNLGANSRNAPQKAGRHKFTPSSLSAIVKDKDDFAADGEMTRLSKKRKDVDAGARETEEIKRRAIARQPVSAESVLHDRGLLGGSQLNVFERGEIVDYEKEGIYFTGTRSARKIIGSLTLSPQPGKDASKDAGGTNNFGYDDERGDYNIILGDHLAYRYEVVDILGKGSFGQVVRCVDHKEGGVVAVKIIRNKKRFHQQALVEVGILGKLRDWDPDGAHATLSITSSFYFRSHLCIVTPALSINLYELIRAHNFTGFSLPLIRRFSRQLLATLTLLQSKRIIHCDLKPENILLCEARKADVRVIDFGSSCREEEKVYTYIQSRFYRSPEVILGSTYGLGIDMWSFGCILAELWTGYPLFPGENEQEQLACIMEIFGPPDRHLVERCTRKKLFFDSVGKPRVTVSSKGRRRRPSSKTLQQALKADDDAFVDFISRCLRWDPDRRLKPHEAVSHPFITNQPFNQRQGIPDEARRAARVRSTAAVPASSTTNGGIPSPVKRGNAFAQQQTPAKEKSSRQLPETPQTAVRNGVPANSNATAANANHASPSKTGGNRRHSTVATAGAAAMAGSKRASNGAVLAAGMGGTSVGGATGAQRMQGQGGSGNGSLAQLAARESMGVAGNGVGGGAGSARWK